MDERDEFSDGLYRPKRHDDYQHPATVDWQDILNNAGYLSPEHECRPPIPIRARVVWERDGEEWIGTVALGWAGQLVYVQMYDHRSTTRVIWLRAEDIERP